MLKMSSTMQNCNVVPKLCDIAVTSPRPSAVMRHLFTIQ